MKKKSNYHVSKGFLNIIVGIILIIIVLTLLKVDIRKFMEGELWQSNFTLAKEILIKIIEFS